MLTSEYRRVSNTGSARSVHAVWIISTIKNQQMAVPRKNSLNAVCVWHLHATLIATCFASSKPSPSKPANNPVVVVVGEDVHPLVEVNLVVVAEEAIDLEMVDVPLILPLFLIKTRITETWARVDLVEPILGKLSRLQRTTHVTKGQEDPVKRISLKIGCHSETTSSLCFWLG